ncbi:LysR family transcriptional regulator, partial [Acinetobacter baumannii]
DYDFHSIQLLGAWANRKLLLATQNFSQLPSSYKQFADFLLEHRP